MLLSFIGLLIVAYLCGSLNSAIIVCKLWGLPSPRSVGSGNPGTTNVLRLGSKKAAVVTLLGDAVKGLLPVLLGHALGLSMVQLCWVALLAVIGHMFPVFFSFKGGKGVATTIGVLLGVSAPIGGWFILIWLVIAAVFRISSLAALIATIATPFLGYWLLNPQTVIPLIIVALLVLARHHANIKRLLTGKEPKIGQKK